MKEQSTVNNKFAFKSADFNGPLDTLCMLIKLKDEHYQLIVADEGNSI